MEEKHILQLIQNLVDRFDYLGYDNFNLERELNLIKHPITFIAISDEDLKNIEKAFLERINYKKSFQGALLVPVSVVTDPKLHEEWYEDWYSQNKDSAGLYYWSRLEDFLSHELTNKFGPERAGRIVRSIDEATHIIISKLANPLRNTFNYKGLVVGFIQSGKTSNFTALIAKAADAGYKLIIVLSGIHSILRRQTQIRLDKELTGMNDLQLNDSFIPEPSDIKRWNRLTTSRLGKIKSRDGQIVVKDLGEFDIVNIDPFDSICKRSTPTLAVIKKNVSVLDKLLGYLQQSTEENRAKLPILMIDDEADQASIDTNANDPESDPTSTNERIRLILKLFPRKAYVGYTATPFANVLINMSAENSELLDDLYPRNFIVSLPEPENYFGTSKIFKGSLAEFFVREVNDDAITLISNGVMTQHLSEAIDQFILSCAIRNIRGDKLKPMSMLVHVSHRISHMSLLTEIITNYLESIAGRYRDPLYSEILKSSFNDMYMEFSNNSNEINHNLSFGNILPEYESIWLEIGDVLNILRPIELNSASDDKLDYTTDKEIKLIAIGGNQLSRGLTLEGLMTSYYLRVSRQYDTLLQMGRWFGYRSNYEDLTRIHTTEQIWGFFEHLALVEEALRGEIYRYEELRLTPVQLAVSIMAHRNLRITATNKMGAATQKQSSFSGALCQTIWFDLDKPNTLVANYKLGDSFIAEMNRDYGFAYNNEFGAYVSEAKIPGEKIFNDFLTKYQFISHESTGGPGLDSINMINYIFRRIYDHPSELNNWSLGIVSNSLELNKSQSIEYGGLRLNMIQRSRKHRDRGYNIGVLTEPEHLRIDLNENNTRDVQNPLLLLYLIWKDSKAIKPLEDPLIDQRIDLFRFVESERVDVLGLAIQFPESKAEPNSFVGQ
jgi:hypothetical protein